MKTSSLESMISGFVLPALAALLEAVQKDFPELETSVLVVMSEVEASRRVQEPSASSRSQSRRDSASSAPWSSADQITGSPSSATGSEKVKEKVNKLFNKPSNVPFWKK